MACLKSGSFFSFHFLFSNRIACATIDSCTKVKGVKVLRKIYIVLTYTGTILSRIVKFYTGKEYSHVSIALDENLEEMYSFGRLHPYVAFIGGFVHERINVRHV